MAPIGERCSRVRWAAGRGGSNWIASRCGGGTATMAARARWAWPAPSTTVTPWLSWAMECTARPSCRLPGAWACSSAASRWATAPAPPRTSFGGFRLGGHGLGPGQMQDRGFPGLKAAGAAQATEPCEGQLGHREAGVRCGPLGHGQPVQPLRLGGAPGLAGIHLGHQGSEGPLQGACGGQLRGRQTEGLGFEEQQAVGKVLGQGGFQPATAPVEHALAVVVAGEAPNPELVQQSLEAVVADATPLAAQIHHAAVRCGGTHHAPAHALAGFEHPHRQAFGLQAAGSHQARESRPHDQHVDR